MPKSSNRQLLGNIQLWAGFVNRRTKNLVEIPGFSALSHRLPGMGEMGNCLMIEMLNSADEPGIIPFEWGSGSVGRARPSHGRGQGFESPLLHQFH